MISTIDHWQKYSSTSKTNRAKRTHTRICKKPKTERVKITKQVLLTKFKSTRLDPGDVNLKKEWPQKKHTSKPTENPKTAEVRISRKSV